MTCPCGSTENYEACCGLYHNIGMLAPTAEALMRSRYSAFAKRDIAYLKATTWPARQKYFDEVGYLDRATNSIWLGLTIHETEAGKEEDKSGTVTFTAKSMISGNLTEQHEKSLFKRKDGQWYYVKPLK